MYGDVYNSDGAKVRHVFGAWNKAMFCGEENGDQVECIWRACKNYTSVQDIGGEIRVRIRGVSSFQGVGIEEFHCIQRCPHFRGFE